MRPGTFGDDHIAVGQEIETPRMFQPIRDNVRLNANGFRVENPALCTGGSEAGRHSDGDKARMGQITERGHPDEVGELAGRARRKPEKLAQMKSSGFTIR